MHKEHAGGGVTNESIPPVLLTMLSQLGRACLKRSGTIALFKEATGLMQVGMSAQAVALIRPDPQRVFATAGRQLTAAEISLPSTLQPNPATPVVTHPTASGRVALVEVTRNEGRYGWLAVCSAGDLSNYACQALGIAVAMLSMAAATRSELHLSDFEGTFREQQTRSFRSSTS